MSAKKSRSATSRKSAPAKQKKPTTKKWARVTTRSGKVSKARGTASLANLSDSLFTEVRELIVNTRQSVAVAVNAALTTLYWQIGVRIRTDILKENRAEYGEQIVAALGRQLAQEFGRGFEEKNLRRMVQFVEAFPDGEIVAALRRQLGWTHFKQIIPLKDPLQRDFYAEMCRLEGWSTRTLQQKINGMLYERTALSKKPDKLIRQELDALRIEDKLTPDLVFKDPYFLDFLGLKDTYSEKDLEAALLREIERLLLELGTGFAFVERQKRIVIDGEDLYLDLLFFHRRPKPELQRRFHLAIEQAKARLEHRQTEEV